MWGPLSPRLGWELHRGSPLCGAAAHTCGPGPPQTPQLLGRVPSGVPILGVGCWQNLVCHFHLPPALEGAGDTPVGADRGVCWGPPGWQAVSSCSGLRLLPLWFWEPAMQRHVGGGNVQVMSVHLLPPRAASGTAAWTVIPVLTPRNGRRLALTARNRTALRVTGWDCGHSGGTRPTDGGGRNLLRTGGWAGLQDHVVAWRCVDRQLPACGASAARPAGAPPGGLAR